MRSNFRPSGPAMSWLAQRRSVAVAHARAELSSERGAAVRADAPVKSMVFVGGLSTRDPLCADLAQRMMPVYDKLPKEARSWQQVVATSAPLWGRHRRQSELVLVVAYHATS